MTPEEREFLNEVVTKLGSVMIDQAKEFDDLKTIMIRLGRFLEALDKHLVAIDKERQHYVDQQDRTTDVLRDLLKMVELLPSTLRNQGRILQ
jgi:hypothetical protein